MIGCLSNVNVKSFRVPLKIQSSPKCKAWEKFRGAAYGLYVSEKFFPQRRSWDEIWIFRGALLMGSRQVVRHWILIPAFVGSIPTSPASFQAYAWFDNLPGLII
jgi:hypothetical protein